MNEIESITEAIKQDLCDFQRRYEERTNDPCNFIKINELEEMWGTLRSKLVGYGDNLVKSTVSRTKEKALVQKKKRNSRKKESS